MAGDICQDWPLGDTFQLAHLVGYKVNIIREFDVQASTNTGTRNHAGIDLQYYTGTLTTIGAPVYAAASGVVECVQPNYNPGQAVVLRHINTYGSYVYTMYGHISTTLAAGTYVLRGGHLGTVVPQGANNSNTHLHFEVRNFGSSWQGSNLCAGDGYADSERTAASQGWLNPVEYYFNNRKPFYSGTGVVSDARTPYPTPNPSSTPYTSQGSISVGSTPTLRASTRETTAGSLNWWYQFDYPQSPAYVRAYWNGISQSLNSVLEVTEPRRTCTDGCGTTCTQCIIDYRPDIMPFYRPYGWSMACSGRDAIIANWCGPTMDPPACQALKTGLCASACASAITNIPLTDPGIENSPTGQYGSIEPWGPWGAWAYHSQYPRQGNQTLGNRFGYYSAGTQETVGQILTAYRFSAGRTYTFRSWAQGGGDNTGVLPYQIGYAATENDRNSFFLLANNPISVGTDWVQRSGVSYTVGASGDPAAGKQIIVRFGSGGQSDIWFDNLSLTMQ